MSEPYFSRVHTEDVVLDIGNDAGAVILFTPKVLQGEEIEIAPTADPARKTHAEVVERLANGRTMYTGVFPPLRIGTYRICRPTDRAGEPFTVRSGKVTQIYWL